MSTRSAPYLDAIDHLPPGAILVIPHVSWGDYEELLEDLGERPDLRVTYDDERLEIMTTADEHEEYKDVIAALARVFSEEVGIMLETRGSATRKRRSLGKGIEPDTSFYVANARHVIGKRKIDPEVSRPQCSSSSWSSVRHAARLKRSRRSVSGSAGASAAGLPAQTGASSSDLDRDR